MIVTILSLKFYINGHENWRRNTDQLLEYVKRVLPEKVKNTLQWTTLTPPKLPSKVRLIGYSVSVNHIKKDWKASDIYTFVKTNYLAMKRLIHHYATANGTYYCFPW